MSTIGAGIRPKLASGPCDVSLQASGHGSRGHPHTPSLEYHRLRCRLRQGGALACLCRVLCNLECTDKYMLYSSILGDISQTRSKSICLLMLEALSQPELTCFDIHIARAPLACALYPPSCLVCCIPDKDTLIHQTNAISPFSRGSLLLCSKTVCPSILQPMPLPHRLQAGT